MSDWWTVGPDGENGVAYDSADQAVWSDEGTRILDEAMDRIALVFLLRAGRMPSRAELEYGISYSVGQFLKELADRPRNAPRPTEEDREALREADGPNDLVVIEIIESLGVGRADPVDADPPPVQVCTCGDLSVDRCEPCERPVDGGEAS